MIVGIWYAIRHGDDTEMHLFPVDSDRSACNRRIRGQDNERFLCHGPPSGPTGCVCRECWNLHSDDVLKSVTQEIEGGQIA